MRNALLFISTVTLLFLLFTRCQKEFVVTNPPLVIDTTVNNNNNTDDQIQVLASVNGVVLDENNLPTQGVTVKCGSQTAVTNSTGIFFFKNLLVSKNNGSITVSKSGYFKGTRTFLSASGKTHFIRIKLIKHSLSATLPASAGGSVNLGNGASIVFPSNAFSYPNGNIYNGNVKVFAKYINPDSLTMHLLMPGDLRGIRKNGLETILTNYGTIGADLFDDNGNAVVIATGKKASLEFPIPSTTAPIQADTIALWHFDDSRSRWLEVGSAMKSAGKIKADVNSFSFWSINESAGFVRINTVIMNSIDSTPVGNQMVRFTVQGTNESCFGYTACTGFVMSGVPVGQPIVMDIIVSNSCGNVLHSQNIGPFTTSTSLDTIWIVAPYRTFTMFTGHIKNCQGNVASNSYISLYSPSSGSYIFTPDSATGYFTLPVFNCQNTTVNYSYQVTEFGTSQQSAIVTGSTTTSTVDLGNVVACANQPVASVYVFGSEQFPGPNSIVKYWKNGVATNVSDGLRSSYTSHAFISTNNDIYIAGSEWDSAGYTSNAKLWINGVKTDIAGFTFLDSRSSDVFVNGTDVYVAYDIDNIMTGYSSAKLWKNGSSTTLSNDSANFHTYCVYVSGNDVYVGGTRTPQASIVNRAVIWKNGVAQYLNNGEFNSIVTKILVNGNDVYAVGQDNVAGNGTGRAVIWKNGVPTYLTDGVGSDAMANDIFIDGTDIYVCGRRSTPGSGEKVQVWKNGVVNVLSASGSSGIGQSIFVKNGDVYVGEVGLMNSPVRLWKNNIPTLITSGNYNNSVRTVIVK